MKKLWIKIKGFFFFCLLIFYWLRNQNGVYFAVSKFAENFGVSTYGY